MATSRLRSLQQRRTLLAPDRAAAASLCAAAASSFHQLYESWLHSFSVIGAVLVSVLAAASAEARLAPRVGRDVRWFGPAAGAVALVAWTAVTVGREPGSGWTPRVEWLREVGRGAVGGWSMMLTSGLPPARHGAVAALPVLAAGVAALAADAARRLRPALAPAFPPLVLLVVGLGFTGHTQRSLPAVGTVAVAALTLLVARLRVAGARNAPTNAGAVASAAGMMPRVPPQGLAALGSACAIALAGGLMFDSGARASWRESYQGPFEILDEISPLSQVGARLHSEDDSVAFLVSFDELPDDVTVDRVALVVLDDYDGSVWSNDTRFERAGGRLQDGWEPRDAATEVRQRFELADGWTSSFVPAAGRPLELAATEASRFAFDVATGTLAAERAGGLVYEVTSAVAPNPTPGAGDVSTDARAAALTVLPDTVPPTFRTFAAAVGAGATEPYERLVALEAELRSARFGFSRLATPGHSLGRLASLVSSRGADSQAGAADRVGTAEQFASAFALAARADGYPARVVVGYVIDPAAAATGDQVEVRQSDITAWPEVLFEDAGWVRFDPTSEIERDPLSTPENGGDASLPADAPTALDPEEPANCLELGTCLDVAGRGFTARTMAMTGAALAVLLIPTALWAARALQRRRRRHGDAARRVVGSWLTVRDRLRLAGVPVPAGYTAGDMANATDVTSLDRLAGVREALAGLSPLVDIALYHPAEPGDDVVRAARSYETSTTRAIGRAVGVPRRLAASLDPRPLVWEVRRARTRKGVH